MTFAHFLITVGQLLLGSLFVWAGLNHFGPGGAKVAAMLSARGVPMPREALYAASVFELICGACLMLGVAVAPAALGLALFTIVASVVLVNFWDQPEGELREALKGVFASNAAIVGGLLIAAAEAM
ncbi:DoxX family protein [Sphingosinicella sp.]|uniref:DoxX family protein n=1 Tax=Sphingosinicella sp. TaxID=1917971 RepID=UPI0026354565|nr:DoxX family protein [Sphingosinicella sp.]